MPKVLCIYGTTSGNTELVVQKVATVLQEKQIEVTLQRAECSSPADLENNDLYILAASTYGHGILQDYMIPFAKEMKDMSCAGKKFAVIGLGDNKYDAEYHIESARILEKLITECGGERVITALKISKSPIPQLEEKVQQWAEEVADILQNSSEKN